MASRTDNKIWIIDTTLRDGEQSPGLVFSKKDKIEIASMLADLGVDELEAGYPAIGDFEIENIKELVKLKPGLRLTSWSRAKKCDIDKALEAGTESIHISFPVSELMLKSIGKDTEWLFENIESNISYAKRYFKYVSVGAMDASRADKKILIKFLFKSAVLGADRIRIADTIGILNPLETFKLISKIKKINSLFPIEFHAHNDLGMATANAISAVIAGCNALSVTVNGIGERAGNAPLEEIVMALKYSLKKNINIKTDKLANVCETVSKLSGIKIPVNKPVTGSNIYKHESGIHCKGLLFNRDTFELFHAADTGKSEEQFVLGKHSGISSVIKVMSDNGYDIDKNIAGELLEKIKVKSGHNKGEVTTDEIINIYREIISF